MKMELLAEGDVETRLASGLEPCRYCSLGTVPSSNDGNDVEGYVTTISFGVTAVA